MEYKHPTAVELNLSQLLWKLLIKHRSLRHVMILDISFFFMLFFIWKYSTGCKCFLIESVQMLKTWVRYCVHVCATYLLHDLDYILSFSVNTLWCSTILCCAVWMLLLKYQRAFTTKYYFIGMLQIKSQYLNGMSILQINLMNIN